MKKLSILTVFFISLWLLSCSKHEKNDLLGTWKGTIAFPLEYAEAIRATLPEHVNVDFSDLDMVLSLHKDDYFSWTNDFEVTFLTQGKAVWVRKYKVRQNMAGPWNFALGKLDLTVRDASALPLDDFTSQEFEKKPSIKKAWTPQTQGFLEALRFKVEEADGNRLVLKDPLYGYVNLVRY